MTVPWPPGRDQGHAPTGLHLQLSPISLLLHFLVVIKLIVSGLIHQLSQILPAPSPKPSSDHLHWGSAFNTLLNLGVLQIQSPALLL